MAADTPRFMIDGVEYPIPVLDQLTLTEAVVINQATGLALADIVDHGGETLIVGLVAVALKRGHPGWPVATVIDRLNKLDAGTVEVIGGPEPDELPPPNKPDATFGSGGNSESPGSSDSVDESATTPDA